MFEERKGGGRPQWAMIGTVLMQKLLVKLDLYAVAYLLVRSLFQADGRTIMINQE